VDDFARVGGKIERLRDVIAVAGRRRGNSAITRTRHAHSDADWLVKIHVNPYETLEYFPRSVRRL